MDPFPSVGGVYAEFLPQFGGSAEPETLEKRFWAAFTSLSDGSTRRPGSDREFWKAVVLESVAPFVDPSAQIPLFEALYEAFSHAERWKLRHGVRETLTQLKAKGLRLIVLSNNDHRLHTILREFELDAQFEQVFVSETLGMEKPDPALFRHVQSTLQVAPGAILHIGDSLVSDGRGPIQAGWQACLLAPASDPEGIIPAVPDIPALVEHVGSIAP